MVEYIKNFTFKQFNYIFKQLFQSLICFEFKCAVVQVNMFLILDFQNIVKISQVTLFFSVRQRYSWNIYKIVTYAFVDYMRPHINKADTGSIWSKSKLARLST